MRQITNVIVLALLGLAMLSGCPRDTDSSSETSIQKIETPDIPSGRDSSDAAEAPAVDATHGEGDVDADAAHGEGDVDADATHGEGDVDADTAVADIENGETTDGEQGDEMTADSGQADVTTVVLETTKGDIVFAVHADWAPIGAAHFLELVNAGFYDGAPWFRVIDGFVAQCGVAADPVMNAQWGMKTIMDEPVVTGNRPGFVAFGTSGENSRSTHIFINFGDNTRSLDGQGFACFAQVVEGFDVAQELFRCEWGDQFGLAQEGGLAKFKQAYPEADFIVKAYVR